MTQDITLASGGPVAVNASFSVIMIPSINEDKLVSDHYWFQIIMHQHFINHHFKSDKTQNLKYPNIRHF